MCEALVYPGEQGESKVVGKMVQEETTVAGRVSRSFLPRLGFWCSLQEPRGSSFPFIAPPSVIIAHLSSLSLHHLGRPSWADS